MAPETKEDTGKLWTAHPDDAADVAAASLSVDRGELLSPEASEAFLCWLEGNEDASWREECG